ncbi:MAG: hypothetical protein OXG71_06605 [Rhodospirillales bacterium]|nr:hypothetical protein [Rhodospirillales bacterium]
MNGRTCHGNGRTNPRAAGSRTFRRGAGWRTRWCGWLAGAVLGACLLTAGEAGAYQQVSGTEGEWIDFYYNLPTFPHEGRSVNPGYKAVRYKIYTEDNTATNSEVSFDCDTDEDWDYFGLNGFYYTLTSNNNYSKTADFSISTCDDEFEESNETFWLYLKEPEVIPADSTTDTWETHGGSHHVPSSISFHVTIVDND